MAIHNDTILSAIDLHQTKHKNACTDYVNIWNKKQNVRHFCKELYSTIKFHEMLYLHGYILGFDVDI